MLDGGEYEREPFCGPHKRRGTFRPKRTDDLRSEVVPLIGRTFLLMYAGIGDHDEAYPGQTRWMIHYAHDAELTDEERGWWMPEQDIEFDPT